MKGEKIYGGTSYLEFSFEETYPDGSKHYCGVSWTDIKTCRNVMNSEIQWLKEQLNKDDLSEETRTLRQSQLDTIQIVSREITITDWHTK